MMLEDILRKSSQPDGTEEEGVVKVSTEALCDYFSQLVTPVNKDWSDSFTVFVIKPLPIRFLPEGYKNARYAYQVPGAKGLGASWVGCKRFIVIDVMAGPLFYGRFGDVEEGNTNPESFPHLERDGSETVKRKVALEGRLTASITRGIKHVFLGDILFDELQQTDKILMPIIVLRDHTTYNPLVPGTDYSIDIRRIEDEVSGMLLSSQNFDVVPSLRYLHTHMNISIPFSTSKRSRSTFSVDLNTHHFDRVLTPYLDTQEFIKQLRKNHIQIIQELIPRQLSKIPHSKGFSPNRSGGNVLESRGTRILPIYVFSVEGYSNNFFLDNYQSVVSYQDAVIVIQRLESDKSPFMSESGTIELDIKDATANIIAGITMALGGVTPPQIAWDEEDNRLERDYTWSTGHHPFGPFAAKTSSISPIFTDAVIRNQILSRLSYCIDTLRSVSESVDNFAKKYMYDPLGNLLSDDKVDGAGKLPYEWMSALYRKSHSTNVKQTIELLRRAENRVVLHLNVIAELVSKNKLQEAYPLSKTFITSLKGLEDYVAAEIREIEGDMVCCDLQHDVVHEVPWLRYGIIVTSGIIAFFIVLRFTTPKRRPRPLKKGSQSTTYSSVMGVFKNVRKRNTQHFEL